MRKKYLKFELTSILIMLSVMFMPSLVSAAEPNMVDYAATPIFIEKASVQPNILILLDNSKSMNTWAYEDETTYDSTKKYYGYFNPDFMYTAGSSAFEIDAAGDWSGNFLNFLTMKRIDVVRKVLTGGKALSVQGGGVQEVVGESVSDNQSRHRYCVNSSTISPYNGDYCYGVNNGNIYVDATTDTDSPWNAANADKFQIVVKKDATYEPEDFLNGDTIAGVLQKVGTKARWGNMWFADDGYQSASNDKDNGGKIQNGVSGSTNFANMIADIANEPCETYTPLAEAYYVAMEHFKGATTIDSSLNYLSNALPNMDVYDDSEACAKNFVLLLTDGASTRDAVIPSSLKDFADAYDTFVTTTTGTSYTEDSGKYTRGGTDFLKDIALYARTTDLRSDQEGTQNILLYTVYAFGDDSDARDLLMEAARMGGFEDRDGDNRPDGGQSDPAADRYEWDMDGDAVPDTYYEASDGYLLHDHLLTAITDILRRASSGTAASVLATNEEGEGNMTQAYFKPTLTSGSREVTWTGYLQSLWIDACGNLREDSNLNHTLDTTGGSIDKIIEYYFDDATSETKVKRYSTHVLYSYPNNCDAVDTTITEAYDIITLDEVKPIFEAGSNLADKAASERNIFTFIDMDANEQVDEGTSTTPFDADGELVTFNTGTTAGTALPNTDAAYYIKPYLGLQDSSAYTHLGATHDERVINLVNYIRGVDMSSLRNRTMSINSTDKVWKLGDIIHSTPITVAKPAENFHLIYSDESYQSYYDANKNRETVIYVGSNDGMLHAFTSWQYNSTTGEYVKPTGAPATENIGDELWAYIPQSLLPHLKWLASPTYPHVYYVDMKPKVFDAQINGTWGTFLLLGLRLGGKHIWAEDEDFDYDGTAGETRNFYPTYSCIDISDPRNPKLIWERTYDNIGSSFSIPAVVKVDTKWFAVFGSGPTEYSGWSTQDGRLFVVDLDDGSPYQDGSGNDWLFQTDGEAFFSQAASMDKNLNYSVDAIYIGETYDANGNNTSDNDGRADWRGKMYKISVPCTLPCTKSDEYDATPGNWKISSLFEVERPITSPPSLSLDNNDNVWVYFGTGRFIGSHGDPDWGDLDAGYPDETDSIPDFDDRSNIQQQYLIGIKDPFYNDAYDADPVGTVNAGDYYHNFSISKTLALTDLFDSSTVYIATGDDGTLVFEASQGTPTLFNEGNSPDYGVNGEWSTLVDYVRGEFDGWYIPLSYNGSTASEKSTSKSAIIGGVVLSSTYTPVDDSCEFGGSSAFYAQYYETGTAYKEHVLVSSETVLYDTETHNVVAVKHSGSMVGAPPPSIGIQAGNQQGARAFVQQSTGEVITIDFDPAFNIKSGMSSWSEK